MKTTAASGGAAVGALVGVIAMSGIVFSGNAPAALAEAFSFADLSEAQSALLAGAVIGAIVGAAFGTAFPQRINRLLDNRDFLGAMFMLPAAAQIGRASC